MNEVRTLVVGGGPSGLAVAYCLQGDTLVLEKEASVGGLCRSIQRGEGVFDIGGHSFHTPYPEVHSLVESLLDGGLYAQKREARVYTHGTLIPYPFQKFFDRIPDPDVVAACEEGLRNAAGDPAEAANFEDYIVRKFGRGIAEHFMLPYNRKLWARDIRRISCEWVSERVAAPRGERESFEVTGGKRKPLHDDTRVGYPGRGGYGEIFESLASRLPGLNLNSEVVRIDPFSHVAVTADGRQYRWQILISTIPLPTLVDVVEGVPEEIAALARRLEYMSLRVELLLVGRQVDSPIQRIYVADHAVIAHKIALNHNSSSYLRARGQHAIMAEVSISPEKAIDPDEIAPNVTAFLHECGFLRSPRDVLWRGHIDVKYAYPVYTHERPALVGGVKEWMARHHIYTLGRFGDWEYMNSDACVVRGLELGRELSRRYPHAMGA